MEGIHASASPIPKLDLTRTRSKRSAQAAERSPAFPVRTAKADAKFLMGASPGRISIQDQPFASRGCNPARISEDFPDPDPPTMATKRFFVTWG
jgi:hypothetical protein